ncbi:MAG: hypothetical protein M1833_007050 [Piccolia ochrophora]|nr:MAG: hypothetical protein M1833_007050 [Piccolia ochrophora]
MSLVFLKKLFAGRATPKIAHPRRGSVVGPIPPGSNQLLDLEKQGCSVRSDEKSSNDSQTVSSEKDTKPFKVNARMISDAIIGLSDGLTVPFALTAGLSAFGEKRVVIFGGLAELIAGAISMGLGGYLGAKSEAESYKATLKETEDLVDSSLAKKASVINAIFEPYNLPPAMLDPIVQQLQSSPSQQLTFFMHFHHNLVEPASSRAVVCAATIAAGYFFGGFIPLIPYFFVGHHELNKGLYISVGVMAVCLFVFGYGKTCIVTGWRGRQNAFGGLFGGLQMLVIGATAAGAAVGLVKGFNSIEQH